MFLSMDGESSFRQNCDSINDHGKGERPKDMSIKAESRLTVEKERDRPSEATTGTPFKADPLVETQFGQ